MNTNFSARRRPRKGPVAQLLTLIGAVLVLVAAFMFSLIFFAVIAVAGLGLWAYFWWTTRALRRQMREHLAAAQASGQGFAPLAEAPKAEPGGEIIDGEAVRVVDEGRRLDP